MTSKRWLAVATLALSLTATAAGPATAAAQTSSKNTQARSAAAVSTPKRTARLSDAKARQLLKQNRISVYSSGNCSNRKRANCTSLDTIKAAPVLDAIALKKASGCTVLITAGTEVGHAKGTYSHWNGYKVDINRSACLSKWIPKHYKKVATNKWQRGNTIYWLEGSHWDVTARS